MKNSYYYESREIPIDKFLARFYRTTHMHSADYAVTRSIIHHIFNEKLTKSNSVQYKGKIGLK